MRDANSLSALMIARDDHDSALSAAPKPRHHLQGFFKKIIEYQNDNEHSGMMHNHPSGEASPGAADRSLTKALAEALALVDVRVLDHFIVAAGEPLSLAERGLL